MSDAEPALTYRLLWRDNPKVPDRYAQFLHRSIRKSKNARFPHCSWRLTCDLDATRTWTTREGAQQYLELLNGIDSRNLLNHFAVIAIAQDSQPSAEP